MIDSAYVAIYQIKKFLVNILFVHYNKMSQRLDDMFSWNRFGLRAVVWRPLA